MIASSDTAALLPSLLDAVAAPDDLAQWARTVAPGSAVVKPLTFLQPEQFSAAGQVDAIAALEAQIAWLQARQLRLIAALAEDLPAHEQSGRRFVTEEVSCALRISHASGEARVALAEQLCRQFPDTVALVERGEITVLHARYLVEHTRHLDATACSAVEERVLRNAAGQSHAEFRRSVQRACLAVETRAAEERHQAARGERRVELSPGDDGMAHLYAFLPAADAQLVMDRLTRRAAERCPHDERTIDQRRADALVELAAAGPDGRPITKPAVNVTVALSTLLEFDDQPGELSGHGPIPAALAREIAGDPTGTWRRLVTDDRGQLLDAGRTTYRPPASMRRHVHARDRTCRFAHCHQPARRTEVDHVRDWEHGGETNAANLQSLCSRHHHTKHDGHWRVTRRATGETEWTSALGKRYVKAAATYPATTGPPPF